MNGERITDELVNLQFSPRIIKLFKAAGIYADNIGSVCVILYALKQEKLSILEELDDASSCKRMMYLYQTMVRRELLKEAGDKDITYYLLSEKGEKLLEAIANEINDEEPSALAQVTEVKKIEDEQIVENDDWMLMYVKLFPEFKQCHVKILPERFQKFKKTFPEYWDKNLILRATSAYIKEAAERENGLEYIRMAHFFIWKLEGGSTTFDLSIWCQKILAKNNKAETDYDTNFMNVA